jgi:cyclase
MPKKRLIFTLLYNNGYFMLSRNFRLQRVGDIKWLKKNYNFSRIAFAIDELVVLDVSRGERDILAFCDCLKAITDGCFVPVAAGGGIRRMEDASALLRAGADKVVVNSPLFTDRDFITTLSVEFGQQCVVGSVDCKRREDGAYRIWHGNGACPLDGDARDWLRTLVELPVGELYLNSMDRDGTGQGYDFQMMESLPTELPMPLILAGGAGNHHHFAVALDDPRIDAVATAHLHNFVADGLKQARKELIDSRRRLAVWPESDISTHAI